jgi:hypothetical protein
MGRDRDAMVGECKELLFGMVQMALAHPRK